jgi:hypothetical protein
MDPAQTTKKTRNQFGLQRVPSSYLALDEATERAQAVGVGVTPIIQPGTNIVERVEVSGFRVAMKRGTASTLHEVQIAADSLRGILRKVGALRPNSRRENRVVLLEATA